jgi:hypothetical protein
LLLAAVAQRAAADDDLTPLSDEFDDASTLAQWSDVRVTEKWPNNQLATCQVNGQAKGALLLEPHTSSWYQDYRGALLYKLVEGDFVVSADIAATGRDGKGPPQSDFSLAGIMLRSPRDVTPQTWRPGGENYVFLSLGAAREPGRYVFEIKTTRNSDSHLEIQPGTGRAVVRAVRIGPAIVLLSKSQGGGWAIRRRYRRPDMPAALQVGITCYTDWSVVSRHPPQQHNSMVIRDGRPDLRAVIDYVRFARPTVPDAWRGRDASDSAQVPDAQILAAFGSD